MFWTKLLLFLFLILYEDYLFFLINDSLQKDFLLVNVSQLITPFFCKDEETNSIFFTLLFSTATKNQIITIFIPFSTSSSKCRITPRSYGFFSTNGGPPLTPPMGGGRGGGSGRGHARTRQP